MKKKIFSIILTLYSLGLMAQEATTIVPSGIKGSYFSLSYQLPISSTIDHSVNQDLIGSKYNLSTKSSYSPYNIKAEMGSFLSEHWGFGLGFGTRSYHSEMALDSIHQQFDTFDSENIPMQLRLWAKNINEVQDIIFLDFSIVLKFQYNFNEKLSMYANGGIVFSGPIRKRYDASARFTYQGYYSIYNVLLKDLPQYDFPTDTLMSSKSDLMVKNDIGYTFSAGLNYKITPRIELFGGISLFQGGANITKNDMTSYKLSERKGEYNSLLSVIEKAKAKNISAELGVRYHLNWW